MMQLTLAELQKKCANLNLTVTQSGKRPAKKDYVDKLKAHFMPEEGLPYKELEPMLCFAEWNLEEEERKAIWSSANWLAQRKLNGCRVVLHFIAGVGVFAHSRTVSVKTFRLQELTESLLIKDFIPSFNATVDAEAIIEKPIDSRPYTTKGELTKTSLHSVTSVLHLEPENGRRLQIEQNAPIIFKVFDITMLDNKDLRKMQLQHRMQFLSHFRGNIESTEIGKYFEFPEVVYQNKRAYFEKIVAEGGEGVILKNVTSSYIDSTSRSREAWVKVKKRIEYDCFVSGFKPGEPGSGWENLVGALKFSINTDKGEWELGYASNITLEERKAMTGYVNGAPVLKDEYYGRVAQISGQDISARSLRLSHCTIDRWRTGADGKSADECFVGMESLREAAEWVG